jgi:ABC-type branched-subunit amino acid transport system substrate-binding protein
MPTRAVDNTSDPTITDFVAAYTEKYGSSPGANDFWMLSYYDSVRMLARAMEIAGTSTDLNAIGEAIQTPEAAEYPVRGLSLTYNDNAANYPNQIAFVDDGTVEFQDQG